MYYCIISYNINTSIKTKFKIILSPFYIIIFGILYCIFCILIKCIFFENFKVYTVYLIHSPTNKSHNLIVDLKLY